MPYEGEGGCLVLGKKKVRLFLNLGGKTKRDGREIVGKSRVAKLVLVKGH